MSASQVSFVGVVGVGGDVLSQHLGWCGHCRSNEMKPRNEKKNG